MFSKNMFGSYLIRKHENPKQLTGIASAHYGYHYEETLTGRAG